MLLHVIRCNLKQEVRNFRAIHFYADIINEKPAQVNLICAVRRLPELTNQQTCQNCYQKVNRYQQSSLLNFQIRQLISRKHFGRNKVRIEPRFIDIFHMEMYRRRADESSRQWMLHGVKYCISHLYNDLQNVGGESLQNRTRRLSATRILGWKVHH